MCDYHDLEEYKERLWDKKEANPSAKEAYDLLCKSDKNIQEFIQGEKLKKREFIEVIALRRADGYSESTGGNEAEEENIKLEYANNPWKFVEEFLQNADDCE